MRWSFRRPLWRRTGPGSRTCSRCREKDDQPSSLLKWGVSCRSRRRRALHPNRARAIEAVRTYWDPVMALRAARRQSRPTLQHPLRRRLATRAASPRSRGTEAAVQVRSVPCVRDITRSVVYMMWFIILWCPRVDRREHLFLRRAWFSTIAVHLMRSLPDATPHDIQQLEHTRHRRRETLDAQLPRPRVIPLP